MSNIRTLATVSNDSGFARYLKEINSIPSLTQEEEFMLAKNYLEQHDLAAAHRLVTSHLKLVVKIAMKYKNYGLPVTEMISEGNIGLMQAVKKYNPDLGYRLSTYAMWWIKASIQEYVLKSWSLVKIGTTAGQKKLFFSLGKIKNRITNMYSRAINDDDYNVIASEMGLSRQEVVEMNQRLAGADLSLNRSVTREDSSSGEMIELIRETRPSQEITLMNQQTLVNKKEILSQAIKVLDPREAKILVARKLSDKPSTLDCLSIEYNISKERVRQIENRAFKKVQDFVLSKVSNDGEMKLIAGN